MLLINYIEMARVTGIPLGYLLSRGQQVNNAFYFLLLLFLLYFVFLFLFIFVSY